MSNNFKKAQTEQEIRRIFLSVYLIAANFENILQHEQREASAGVFKGRKGFKFKAYEESIKGYGSFLHYLENCLDLGLYMYEDSPISESELISIIEKIKNRGVII